MLKIYLKLLQKHRPSAGWTLAELMIAAGMTLMVVMVAGFGLVALLKDNQVANATGKMQYDMNRATEFMSGEIRNAKIIEHFAQGSDLREANLDRVKGYSPTFWDRHIKGKGGDVKIPVLALKIEGVYERVIYYIDDVDSNDIWSGPGVLRRFGPSFKLDGTHSEEHKSDPTKWQSSALVDMMLTALPAGQKQCRNLPPDVEHPDTYISTDAQGMEWYRLPQAEADVQGFFVCVREDKQLVQLNIKGTNSDEFKHLYGNKDNQEILAKETRYTDKMQYDVTTMVHARSEAIGSDGESLPLFSVVGGQIGFQEPGQAKLNVLHLDIPCVNQGSGVPTLDPESVQTYITVLDTEAGVKHGLVNGTGSGSSVSVPARTQISAKMEETSACSNGGEAVTVEISESEAVKFATNDNSEHLTLNSVIEDDLSKSEYGSLINTLESQNLINSDDSGTYDFTLSDNQVLYFFEFANHEYTFKDGKIVQTLQEDANYNDGVILIELTK